jgi:hypothetical protein
MPLLRPSPMQVQYMQQQRFLTWPLARFCCRGAAKGKEGGSLSSPSARCCPHPPLILSSLHRWRPRRSAPRRRRTRSGSRSAWAPRRQRVTRWPPRGREAVALPACWPGRPAAPHSSDPLLPLPCLSIKRGPSAHTQKTLFLSSPTVVVLPPLLVSSPPPPSRDRKRRRRRKRQQRLPVSAGGVPACAATPHFFPLALRFVSFFFCCCCACVVGFLFSPRKSIKQARPTPV